MAREKFGNTWWGEEWLKALTHIDYDNRIPRGAAYARKGAVLEVKIEDCTISAKVQGSMRTPYRITIDIPRFSSEETDRLMEALSKEPLLVSKLLNHELSPKAMDIAKELGIKLFPSRWDDLKMKCSCPDWAVPCKHLAAVIYMVSREIDNDPFIVFAMHGVDLAKELEKRGLSNVAGNTSSVPMLSTIIETSDPKTSASEVPESPEAIDFTHLQDISHTLTALLPEKPAFYVGGDFRDIYAAEMQRIKKKARRVLEGRLTLAEATGVTVPPPPLPHEEVRITLNHYLGFEPDLAEVYSVLSIDGDELVDACRSIRTLNQALKCCLHLLANGAVLPQVFQMENKYYTTLWQPVMADKATHDMVEALDSMMPDNLVVLKDKKKVACLKNQTALLLGTLTGCMIADMATTSYNNSDIYNFLFLQDDNPFDGVGEKSIPSSIRSWFERLSIGERKYCPMVTVSIKGEVFAIDLAISTDGLPLMLSDIINDKKYSAIKIEVLREVAMLSPYIPGLEHYVSVKATESITMDASQLVTFLMQMVPSMRMLGIKVVLPKELQQLVRPRITMTIKKKRVNADGVARLSMGKMLDFDWRVAMGTNTLSIEEFNELAGKAHGLIRFKGQYIYVNPDDLTRLDETIRGLRQPSANELLQSALSESYDGAAVALTPEARKMIASLSKQRKMAVPKEIHATLRPYQQRGYEWMYRNSKLGFGSIIADDMGLGKTLQVITLLQKFKNEGSLEKRHVLIVVPTTLISNWQTELQRFAPDLSCQTYHGSGRTLENMESDILLTTYGVARSDASLLKKNAWHTVVIDEAQNIKNADTAQSKAVRSIPAENHIAMSGTPIENRMSEFWSIMDFANHGFLGTLAAFQKRYAHPIQKWGNREVAENFRRTTAPFLLRRLKTDKSIIDDLPDKIEENTYTVLTEQQTALYHETVEHAMEVIENADTSTQQAIFKRQGLVLQLILALKQICNHPALFLKNGETRSDLSGKAETLLTLLESIVSNRQKVIIFTQFKEMGDLLQGIIKEHLGQEALFLHGGCTLKKRSEMVESFQNRPESRIFILSIKAAGTGLNLTAASHVIHYDLWWNPAVEAQATDRAYRIGQHQNVVVHRFITKNTFEEKIDSMIQEKKHLADMTVSTGENWIGNLSNEELNEIFRQS
ncbi:MAG: DEAD/DEAH box helicase family protein [Bacteroidales bacterium]|nr:DEAD/DEAH box helicase family protein [Bacteroidales bacterium]